MSPENIEIRPSEAERPSGTALIRPWVTVKDLEWLAYLYGMRFLAAALPWSCLRLIGRGLEPLFQRIAAPWRRLVEDRIRRTFQANRIDQDPSIVARRFIAHAVGRALEDLAADRLARRQGPLDVEIAGLENLDKARLENNGAIILTGHFFAVRLARRCLAVRGYPMLSVRNHEPPDRFMGRLGQAHLQPRYVEFLHGVIRDEVLLQDRECSLKIFKRLRSGGLVNIHLDAHFSHELVSCHFLIRERHFPTGIARLARLACCPVIPMLCLRTGRGMSIALEEPLALEPAPTEREFTATNVPRMVRKLESQILQHPDQWELWDRL